MSKYHYDIELKVNNYVPSKDYGKPFGFSIIDTNQNRVVKSYLLHDWKMVFCWPFSKKSKAWLEKIAKENGC